MTEIEIAPGFPDPAEGVLRIEVGPTSGTPTTAEAKAFVGTNASDYYLTAWRPALSGEGGARGFNLAAFFLGGLWMGYRKMYVEACLLYVLMMAVTILEEVVMAGGSASRFPGTLFRLVLGIVVGFNANRWYWARAQRVVAEVRARGLSDVDHLWAIANRGGTSLGASIGLAVLFVLANFVLFLLLDIVAEVGGV